LTIEYSATSTTACLTSTAGAGCTDVGKNWLSCRVSPASRRVTWKPILDPQLKRPPSLSQVGSSFRGREGPYADHRPDRRTTRTRPFAVATACEKADRGRGEPSLGGCAPLGRGARSRRTTGQRARPVLPQLSTQGENGMSGSGGIFDSMFLGREPGQPVAHPVAALQR